MGVSLFVIALIILACVFLKTVSNKLGVPFLFLFLILGMILGWTEDYLSSVSFLGVVEKVCSIGLIFIMFYGGFGTNWKTSKPVVKEAGLLATLGVFITAGLTGLFCHFALGWGWVKGFLLGSVICSTDAASVFSILRNRRLGLKNNSAPIIEVESGANDPCSYMLTVLFVSILNVTDPSTTGSVTALDAIGLVFSQIIFGALFGFLIALGAVWVLTHYKLSSGFDSLFIVAIALLSYAIPNLGFDGISINGNGYLSAYIVGIILGNTHFPGKKEIVGFADGVTTFMQILIFYLLGAMSTPEKLPQAILPALIISLFLMLVARPVAVFSILAPFKKYPPRQMAFISFVGLRGAASIVFAIYVITHTLPGARIGGGPDIFSVVFCIVIISILLQGSLIPLAAKLFKVIDRNSDVMKTFNDYSAVDDINFGHIRVSEGSRWVGETIRDIRVPEDIVIAMIEREGSHIVPDGDTVIEAGDNIVFSCLAYKDGIDHQIFEHAVSKNSKWAGKQIKDYPKEGRDGSMIMMIRRGDEIIIPNGETVFQAGDILVVCQQK